MKKFGLVVDSSCGLTKKEVNAMGIGFVPSLINMDGKTYKSGVDIDKNYLYENMDKNTTKISTATALPEDFAKAFKFVLKTHKEVIYVGVNKNISSTQNSARLVVEGNKEFKNNVHIYESIYAAPWIEVYLKDIAKIVSDGKTVKEIYEKLNYQNDKMFLALSPMDITWFYKGGRITRIQYIAGNILSVNPIITIKDGYMDREKVIRCRTIKKSIDKMIEKVSVSYEKYKNNGFKFIVLGSANKELENTVVDRIVEKFNVKKNKIITIHLCPEQIAHMGPSAFGITFKINYK